MKDAPIIDTLFGINSVEARLRAGKHGIHTLQVRTGQVSARVTALVELAETMGVAVTLISDVAFEELTSLNHQGVALQVTPRGMLGEKQLDEVLEADNGPLLLLILDGVTDPRNFGACLRSAATLGAHAVIVPRDNSAPLNAAAAKTASGGASVVPVIAVVNLARCMEQLKARGIWIVGTLLDAPQALGQVDLTGDIALVMGSEERGMRDRTKKACDYLASIPMPYAALGFNVSVATGICLYEVVRQRAAVSS
ncbi:MAG: 23S rRNA (guanosine2251-2'-O)-methyltransferase [Cyclobacteriaceae bacterium]|jgi:23S rRNA (guanosine2251-2'-O)-methyltransferase